MNILFILPWLKTSIVKIFTEIDHKYILINQVEISDPKKENIETFSFLEKLDLSNVKSILMCNWPWRFMSLRLFSSLVNTLSNELGIKIYSVYTAEFLDKKIKSKWQILLQLNQNEVLKYYNWKSEVINIPKIKNGLKWYWYIRNELLIWPDIIKIEESQIVEDKHIIWDFLIDKYLTEKVAPFYSL